jgi:hypothetical protein
MMGCGGRVGHRMGRHRVSPISAGGLPSQRCHRPPRTQRAQSFPDGSRMVSEVIDDQYAAFLAAHFRASLYILKT